MGEVPPAEPADPDQQRLTQIAATLKMLGDNQDLHNILQRASAWLQVKLSGRAIFEEIAERFMSSGLDHIDFCFVEEDANVSNVLSKLWPACSRLNRELAISATRGKLYLPRNMKALLRRERLSANGTRLK